MERRFTKQVFMTAWRRLSLTLLVALCCHTAESAETLTVYDGTNTSNYLPVYGWGVDTQETTCEFVIPKGQLGAMEDGTISALTFYLSSNAAAAWTATIQVYLKEISATTLTGITGPSTSTVVYTGTLDASGTEMTVTFNNSYTYNGGNLLIGTYVSEKSSNYHMTAFYGVTQSVNTACYKKSGSTTLQQFIPKTTFTYTPPSSVVPKPTNLAASNITYEKATITWSSNQSAWNIAWGTNPDFDPASVSTRAENVSEKTYTITDLIQMTDYYVAVQDAVSGRWSPKLHFKTTSQPTAVGDGWSDDFEGATCGWELINGDRTNRWVWGTAVNNGGTHALYISNDYGTTNAYNGSSETIVYAAKLLTFTEGTFDFSYDWQAYGENNSDYLRVALIPATESLTAGATVPTGFSVSALPTGWIALDGGSKLNLATEWQHKDATIDVVAGNYYLVFAWRNDYATRTNPPAAIDNVSISKYPDMITDLAVSEVTTNSATVSWNGNGDSYNVRYRKQFISEDFEGGSMPTGWTSEGDASWSVGTGDNSASTGSYSGNKNAKITHATTGHVTYLITPSMDLSGETSLTLSFWYINRAWGNDKDGFGVYYRVGTDGAWNELWSTTEAHGSWTNQEVALTGLAANYQLGFKMTDGYGYGVGLDDIQIISADWQTVNNITDKSTTLTGLAANTPYGCQVQSVKAGKTSLWSPIATFTTEAAVVLTDGNDLSALSAYAGQTVAVTYLRSFTNGKASTVCVPFAFDVTSAGGTFYTFTGITKNEGTYIADMTASVSTTLTPNTPYVFMPSATGNVDFSGTYAIPATLTASSATSGDWKFYGTYTRLTYGTDPMTGYVYGFASVDATVEGHDVKAGEFVRATTGAGVPPMRCYLIYKDGEAYTNARALTRGGDDEEMPQSIIVRLLDANGQTTSIGSLDMKTGEMEFDGWYSLDGSRLEGKPTKKGLYINNGKKVIIK